MELTRVDDTGSESMATPTSDATSPAHYDLDPGLFQIFATNLTKVDQSVSFTASPVRSSGESLSLGGVGQMPAIAGTSFPLGSATTTAGSISAGEAMSSPATVAVDQTTPGSAASTTIPLVATGSFRLATHNQAPLGSFAAPSAATSPAATSPGAVAVALGSTLSFKLGGSTSRHGQIRGTPSQSPTFGWDQLRSLGRWPTPRRSLALPVPKLIPV